MLTLRNVTYHSIYTVSLALLPSPYVQIFSAHGVVAIFKVVTLKDDLWDVLEKISELLRQV